MPIIPRKNTLSFERGAKDGVGGVAKAAVVLITLLFWLSIPESATAYVGPGAGITLIGALWAVIVAVVLMLGGILIWPIRAMLRRRKKAAAGSEGPSPGESVDKKTD